MVPREGPPCGGATPENGSISCESGNPDYAWGRRVYTGFEADRGTDSNTSQQGTPMSLPVKSPSLQSYQVLLYNRALHPEVFPLKGRRVIHQGTYEFEVWIMSGAHLLRFESGGLCAGERDFEHRFTRDKVTYMTTVQTETLSENLYLATYEEMMDVARTTNAL